jgi:hypothetical protein
MPNPTDLTVTHVASWQDGDAIFWFSNESIWLVSKRTNKPIPLDADDLLVLIASTWRREVKNA